ncbi:MAG: N-acetylmuramoyl-L-alanine amidase, partial [Elusimicrobiota bacterium]
PPHGLPVTGDDELVVLSPGGGLEVRAGDVIVVRCKGPPGLKGTFDIRGLARRAPMAERRRPVAGVYEGHYIVQPDDKGEGLKVSCSLKRGFFSGLKTEAKAKVTILDPTRSRTAEIVEKYAVLKSATGGYTLFLSSGVKLEVVGRRGGRYRVRLSEHEDGWIGRGSVRLLPEGTPPPRAEVGLITNIKVSSESVKILIDAGEKLPFEVRHTIEPLEFQIRFFGASHHFDRVRYPTDGPVVKEVTWRQESSRVVRVDLETHLQWGWGYHADYDDNGHFVIEIRRPPDLRTTRNVLAGRKVIVDAGHGPWKSAVGPLGNTERDVVLEMSFALEEKLLAEGADVYMMRTSSDGPPLLDRNFIAWEERGDFLISMHLNAFSVRTDPFDKPRGFMHFYYQPHSRPLATFVHRAYLKRHPELADEFVRYGNLYVCRLTEMPSILTESGYIILPDQERLFVNPKYRERIADTIVSGLRSYLEQYQKVQAKSWFERRAAAE